MVAAAGLPVEVQRSQRRRRGQCDVAFLAQLALQRLDRRLADLHAAARQLPARHIGVADQEDGIRRPRRARAPRTPSVIGRRSRK